MSTESDREFQKVVMEGLVPKIDGAAVSAVLVTENAVNSIDAKFCTELGVMIMLDKPIMAIQFPGTTVPKKLALVADLIVEADITTPEGQEALQRGLDEMNKRLDL